MGGLKLPLTLALASWAAAAPSIERSSANNTDPLVGAWYFGGWFNCTTPGCYSHFQGYTPRGAPVADFFPAYPERTPLLGLYSDRVATVTAEVAAADAAGLDFFHVLFYDADGERDCGPNPDARLTPCLNAALAFMLNTSSVWAGTTGRLRFALAYSNDVDRARAGMFVGPAGRAEWLSRVGTWVRAMAHPRYLTVGGRPVFQVLIPDIFSSQCGGNATLAAELLQLLRDAGRAAGVGAPVIGGGWLPPSIAPGGAAAPLPHPDGYMRYAQTDVPCTGAPCDLARVPGAAPGDCMAACNATAQCVGFAAYAGNGTCVLKSSAGPGAPGLGDFYVRVLDDIPWEWRGTYNDAPPLCYAGPNRTDPGECPEYHNSWWPNATADGAKIFPYAECARFQAEARGNQSGDAVPYLPNVIAGFDPRPWEEQGPSFSAATRAEWTAALAQARDLVTDPANRVFGLPDATSPTGVRPAMSIYAWNELGEGGILMPTAGDGFMKLECVTAVFGRGTAGGGGRPSA